MPDQLAVRFGFWRLRPVVLVHVIGLFLALLRPTLVLEGFHSRAQTRHTLCHHHALVELAVARSPRCAASSRRHQG